MFELWMPMNSVSFVWIGCRMPMKFADFYVCVNEREQLKSDRVEMR